jgi:hypothetical protein
MGRDLVAFRRVIVRSVMRGSGRQLRTHTRTKGKKTEQIVGTQDQSKVGKRRNQEPPLEGAKGPGPSPPPVCARM